MYIATISIVFMVFLSICLVIFMFAIHSDDFDLGSYSKDEMEYSHAEKMQRWNGIGDLLGLERVDSYPQSHLRLRGEVHGESVEVYRDNGFAGELVTIYEVEIGDLLPVGFGLKRQSAPSIIEGLVDRDDVVVGNDELDKLFVFTGVDDEEVREFVWRKGVEEILVELGEFPTSIMIDEGKLRVLEMGLIPTAEKGAEVAGDLAEWTSRLRDRITDECEKLEAAEPEGWSAPN